MKKFKTNQEWLEKTMPEIYVPSSTLISGSGGSGKPLVGFSLVSSWLKQGGNLIFILTSTGKDFVEKALEKIYGLQIGDYKEQMEFIKFDPTLDPAVDSIKKDKLIKANLANPKVWDEAIEIASKRLKQESELGELIFCSALNLLLFSKTYGKSILNKLRDLIKEDKSKSYLFTVSTSAYREEIRILESAADNLMFTRTEKPLRLFLKITRMKEVKFSEKEIEVPLKTKDLKTIRRLAEGSRENLIPLISKI